MVFSSLTFLFIFLPLALLCYFLLPGMRAKNTVLIVFSFLFYAWGEPLYVFLMVGTAAVNWALALLFEHKYRKLLLTLSVLVDLGALAVFKYAGFFVENLNAVAGLKLAVPQIALPIGISFYTFQILSYQIDAYRGDVKIQRNFARFLMYVSMFPQLIAGPIVRYSDIEAQIDDRPFDWDGIFYGFFRFCIGLAKKVLLADYAGSAASRLLDGSLQAQTSLGVWFGVLMFMFEIYFDFSGYSDMAIGLGRIFGFHFPENFAYPYTSRSIREFWRKWHISLSTFFRDYVYIPLGGNRKHVYLNQFIVWTLTGLWHGASWNFVLWGVYFFVLLALERLLRKQIAKIPNALRHVLTLLLILISWNIFYFTDISRLGESFRVMFTGGEMGFFNKQTGIAIVNSLPLAIFCAIGSTPIPQVLGDSFSMLMAGKEASVLKQRLYIVAMFIFCVLLLSLSVISLTGTTFNAFLYFRF